MKRIGLHCANLNWHGEGIVSFETAYHQLDDEAQILALRNWIYILEEEYSNACDRAFPKQATQSGSPAAPQEKPKLGP